jgi:hypothetical protein
MTATVRPARKNLQSFSALWRFEQGQGNITGATQLNVEVGPKLIELLHEVLPPATTVAALVNNQSQCRNPAPQRQPGDWNVCAFCPLGFWEISCSGGNPRLRGFIDGNLKVPALRDAFTRGRGHFRMDPKPRADEAAGHPASAFRNGTEWVRNVLVAAIERGNAELQPENVAFRFDLNLDSRSTNHAHADLWLTEMGEGECAVGPKYSINVIGGRTVRLYRPGVPGHILGTLEECGPETIQQLLGKAAEEFGKQLGTTARG